MTIHDHMGQKLLELVYGRSLEKFGGTGRRKPKIVKRSSLSNSDKTLEDQNADKIADHEGYIQEVQMKMRTLSKIALDAIHVLLWQRISLCFVYVLKLCRRLSLKTLD